MKDLGKDDSNIDSKVEQTAAEWVVKHEYGLSAAEQDEFNEWLTEDPEHRSAYITQSWSWAEIDRLTGIHKTDHAPVNLNLFDDTHQRRSKAKAVLWSLGAGLAVAASFVLLLTGTLSTKDHSVAPDLQPQNVIVERIEKLRLDDGSVVVLNRGAVLESDFNEHTRRVRLVSGEATFNVTKDIERPFVVEASGVNVRAVGTVFNVRVSEELVDVIVSEGVVALSSDEEQEAVDESYLESHHRAYVELDHSEPLVSIERIQQEALDEELLWQPVLLEFDNTPLVEILSEFNKRNDVKIHVQDPYIKDLRITSVFWSDNVTGFVGLLESYFGIAATRENLHTIELSRRI